MKKVNAVISVGSEYMIVNNGDSEGFWSFSDVVEFMVEDKRLSETETALALHRLNSYGVVQF